MVEMMRIGMRALSKSAEISLGEEEKISPLEMVGAIAVAIFAVAGLFVALPMLVSEYLTSLLGLSHIAKNFTEAGYQLVATRGTAKVIREAGYRCDVVNKVSEGRPNIVDELKNGTIQLVIAVAAESRSEIADASAIRIASLANHVTFYTAMANALAVIEGIRHMQDTEVYAQQELHKHLQH